MNKNLMKSLLGTACLLGCAMSSAQATVLFVDHFDATSNQGPNDQTTNPGRQSGTLATLGYLTSGNTQIGNTATLPPSSPTSGVGNELLVAFGGIATINHDFSTETSPLQISWLGITTTIAGGTSDDWTSLIIGGSSGPPFVTGGNADSILMRAAGGTQIFDHGVASTGATGPNVGTDVWAQYMVVLSDTAGTGSAFGTGGSRADYYMNGTLVGTANFNQLTSGEGFLGFAANKISGYDDITVSTVPEPSSVIAGLAGLAGFALVRRRK
jgi:hypothetical protein